MRFIAFVLVLIPAISLANIIYPMAKEIPNTEIRFEKLIEDEYKWMENFTDPDLWDWIAEEQKLTESQLDPSLMNYFYTKLNAYQELAAKLKKDEEQAQSTENNLAYIPIMQMMEDNKSLQSESPENEDKYEVKTEPVYGGDLTRVKIIKKEDQTLADIMLVKFGGFIKWIDEETLLYSSSNDGFLGSSRSIIATHKVGDNQADDKIILTATHAYESLGTRIAGDQIFVFQTNRITEDSKVSLLDIKTGSLHLTRKMEGDTTFIKDASEVYFIQDGKANYGELKKLNLYTGETTLVIAEQDFMMSKYAPITDEYFLLSGHRDTETVLVIHNTKTDEKREISYLEKGSLRFLGAENKTLKLKFQSYQTPPTRLTYDLDTKVMTEVSAHQYPVKINAKKLYYTASNGQQAAMWMFYQEGKEPNSKTPMIIYGYGGFDITIQPRFNSLGALPWLEKGGAVTVVSLPGSLTYGRSWNLFARRGGRINSWDSFAAAGKELIKLGLTSKEHLGMTGGSNGGLLVAGTLMRHPEVFQAAIPQVGVLDMLNFSLHTAGKYWMTEYGNPFTREHFEELYPISPYHNIAEMSYPATMVMTAEFDDRVMPFHSYKYTARLQQRQQGNAPVLLYNKEWGGHSSRSGSQQQKLNFQAAMFSFFAQHLGL